jgi:OTU domain-containing protein 6
MEEQRRIAAEEAIRMPDLSTLEKAAMQELFQKYDLQEENIRPDGNCLYAAFASQINKTTSKKVTFQSVQADFDSSIILR